MTTSKDGGGYWNRAGRRSGGHAPRLDPGAATDKCPACGKVTPPYNKACGLCVQAAKLVEFHQSQEGRKEK